VDSGGFHWIPLESVGVSKVLEWLVMPFGLSNAPASFQHFMNEIFSDMIDVSIVIYLDDILIYSENLANHQKHIKEVLQRLRKNGLYACADKCEFHSKRVEYLGYILSPKGLTMDQAKVTTNASSTITLTLQFRLPVSLEKGYPSSLPTKRKPLSTSSKEHLPLPLFSLTGSWTAQSSLKPTPRSMP